MGAWTKHLPSQDCPLNNRTHKKVRKKLLSPEEGSKSGTGEQGGLAEGNPDVMERCLFSSQ